MLKNMRSSASLIGFELALRACSKSLTKEVTNASSFHEISSS